jgi:hypothetical protein
MSFFFTKGGWSLYALWAVLRTAVSIFFFEGMFISICPSGGLLDSSVCPLWGDFTVGHFQSCQLPPQQKLVGKKIKKYFQKKSQNFFAINSLEIFFKITLPKLGHNQGFWLFSLRELFVKNQKNSMHTI